MKKLLVASALLALATSTQAQTGQPVPLPLPPKVESNLPGDVAGQDVRLVKGCYVYIYEGEVFPLEDASGKQICK
ncbi:MAG: hypothetical protein AAFO61_08770 [Pseudomonadota bacterium]